MKEVLNAGMTNNISLSLGHAQQKMRPPKK
jgi:hypothetical protein